MLSWFQVSSKTIQLHIHIFIFEILSLCRLLQNTGYSSLCSFFFLNVEGQKQLWHYCGCDYHCTCGEVLIFSFKVIIVAEALGVVGPGTQSERAFADPGELVKTFTATQRRKYLLIIKLYVNLCKTLLRLVELKRISGG